MSGNRFYTRALKYNRGYLVGSKKTKTHYCSRARDHLRASKSPEEAFFAITRMFNDDFDKAFRCVFATRDDELIDFALSMVEMNNDIILNLIRYAPHKIDFDMEITFPCSDSETHNALIIAAIKSDDITLFTKIMRKLIFDIKELLQVQMALNAAIDTFNYTKLNILINLYNNGPIKLEDIKLANCIIGAKNTTLLNYFVVKLKYRQYECMVETPMVI